MSFGQSNIESNMNHNVSNSAADVSVNEYILRSRYTNGKLGETTYADVCKRVCSTVCPEDTFLYQQMLHKKWCPGGRTLAYVGTNQPVSANCLVLPLGSTLDEIIDTLCRALILQKHGMGIGFSFSMIPQDYIYDKPYITYFKRILMLHINHPDILSFIDAKYDSFKKVIIVPDNLLENPTGLMKVRKINYDAKFSMKYPEILSENMIRSADLLELIYKSDCTVRAESTVYESSHYYRVHDDLDDITDVLRKVAKRASDREDFAIDLSSLRKAGSICKADVKSGGPVSFAFIYDVVINAINKINRTNAISWLYVFSACSNIITQTNRNGANIGLLHSNCPNILDFINVKRDLNVINNFNISVCFTDEFMDELNKNPTLSQLVHECTYDDKFIISSQRVATKTVESIWNAFISSSHVSGEPGCIFEGNVNKRYSVLQPYLGRIVACNPCGEIMMYSNEVCNLAAINIEEFVTVPESYDIPKQIYEPNMFNSDTFEHRLEHVLFKRFLDNFNVTEFIKTVKHVVRFLNKIIDMINVPDDIVVKQVRKMRRLGLGLMGYANLLLKLRIPYNSEVARKIAEFIAEKMYSTASMESIMLAKTYGSLANRIGITIDESMSIDEQSLLSQANIATLCCAPTGSIALMLGTSYSIEPEFRMCYKKAYASGIKEDDIVINRYFKQYLMENNAYNINNVIDVSEYGIANAVLYDNNGELFMPRNYDIEVFKCANEITPMEHLQMQASFQKYIDNSISKTINFANESGTDDIDNVFRDAHKMGIKGTTIYRDRCRESQVLSSVSSEDIHCKSGKCDL